MVILNHKEKSDGKNNNSRLGEEESDGGRTKKTNKIFFKIKKEKIPKKNNK
jgi:hypothetical protein